jgi:transposase-like protein
MAHEHKQISRIVKEYLEGLRQMELEVQTKAQNWRWHMTCPSCKSGNEMLFSPMALSFICEEEPCGFELAVDLHTAEILLQPEVELTFA